MCGPGHVPTSRGHRDHLVDAPFPLRTRVRPVKQRRREDARVDKSALPLYAIHSVGDRKSRKVRREIKRMCHLKSDDFILLASVGHLFFFAETFVVERPCLNTFYQSVDTRAPPSTKYRAAELHERVPVSMPSNRAPCSYCTEFGLTEVERRHGFVGGTARSRKLDPSTIFSSCTLLRFPFLKVLFFREKQIGIIVHERSKGS